MVDTFTDWRFCKYDLVLYLYDFGDILLQSLFLIYKMFYWN